MPDESPHWPALVRCAHCGRVLVANRMELLGYTRNGAPLCCGLEMVLYIEAERPGPEDTKVSGVVPLPGSNEGTAIIQVPPARKRPG
jgi:hypothetical protein